MARITKTLEPNTMSFMTSGHDSATALFKEVRSEVRLDTLDKLTREMKRLKDLAYKTDIAMIYGKTKTYVTRMIDYKYFILVHSYLCPKNF